MLEYSVFIRCLIEDEYLIFPVDVWCTTNVEHLKRVIQSERAFLKDVDPQKLELWKVNIDISTVKGLSSLKEKVKCVPSHGNKLIPSKTISDYWSHKPPSRKICNLDVIVRVPTNDDEETWTPGQGNTRIIHQILNSERLVQVRGTLVTGKTTQLKLLQKYILQVEPNAKIRTVSSWPYNDRRPLKWRLDDKLPGVLDERPETVSKTYILIDNGQDTFWDEALWNNFFGDHQQRSTGYRIIVFCTKDHK